MATRVETRQIRLAQWRKIFETKASSGLTAKDFCILNHISRDSYYYWQNLVRQDALSTINRPALVELKPPAKEDALEIPDGNPVSNDFKPQITVTLNEAVVQADANTPRELLKMVLEVLADAE